MSRVRCLIAQPLRSSATWQTNTSLELLRSEPRHPFGYVHVATMLTAHGVDVRFINQVRLRQTDNYGQFTLIRDVLQVAPRFDVVVCYATSGTAIASALSLMPLRRPGLVVYLQAYLNPTGARAIRFFRQKLLERAIQGADATVSVLAGLAQQIKRRYPHKAQCVHYAPVGADTTFFDPMLAGSGPEDTDCQHLQPHKFLLVVGDATRDDQFIYSSLRPRSLPLVRVTRDPLVAQRVTQLTTEYDLPGDILLQQTSFPTLRWLYTHSAAVIFAGNDTWEPAGITALAEALSCGALCICNLGGCIEAEFSHLAGEVDMVPPVVFYERNNSEALRDSVDTVTTIAPPQRALRAASARTFIQQACPVERSHEVLWAAIQQTVEKRGRQTGRLSTLGE